jgi:DNA-binding IscR family transcriptional regulator
VLRDLVRKGFIRSKPGRGGGYSLRVPPQEVRVTDIIAAIDEARDLTKTCVLGLGVCSDENPCELHEVWKRYRQVYLAALARLTLADLAATLKARQSPGSSATPPSSTGRPGVPVPLDRPAANRPPFEVR